jgi:(p)ppGpp synthase/HD superfamily hydrolase
LIKIMDRLHNLKNMHSISVNKQISTTQETLNTVLLACAYLEDINTEFTLGTIINKILKYKTHGRLLKNKVKNSLLNSMHRNHFIDLFKS